MPTVRPSGFGPVSKPMTVIGMLTETYVFSTKLSRVWLLSGLSVSTQKTIGQDLETGAAVAFMGTRNLEIWD